MTEPAVHVELCQGPNSTYGRAHRWVTIQCEGIEWFLIEKMNTRRKVLREDWRQKERNFINIIFLCVVFTLSKSRSALGHLFFRVLISLRKYRRYLLLTRLIVLARFVANWLCRAGELASREGEFALV